MVAGKWLHSFPGQFLDLDWTMWQHNFYCIHYKVIFTFVLHYIKRHHLDLQQEYMVNIKTGTPIKHIPPIEQVWGSITRERCTGFGLPLTNNLMTKKKEKENETCSLQLDCHYKRKAWKLCSAKMRFWTPKVNMQHCGNYRTLAERSTRLKLHQPSDHKNHHHHQPLLLITLEVFNVIKMTKTT